MSTLRIVLPLKFTQGNLDQILNNYYNNSFQAWHSEIIFDLSLLEWINTEEIALLFSWIRILKIKQKKISIWLPYPYDVYKQNLYHEPGDLAIVRQLLPRDSQEHIRRRVARNLFLLGVWGMLDNIGLQSFDFKNIVDGYNHKLDRIREKYSHLVVPFTVISSARSGQYHHNPYSDVINGQNTFRKVGPFDLATDLIQRLEDFDCYSPFENKIISNIITKELFANSLIHANSSGKLDGYEECYFALSLNNKWENTNNENFLNQFLLEKDPDTIDFYKDKKSIIKEIRREAKLLTPEKARYYPKYREAELHRYNNHFRNISYLEFTFLDFGDGIYNTLTNKFAEYILDDNKVRGFKSELPEIQVLEYAFFPESSRNQYNSRLQTPELFPRGLYFLVDMVRRYKGLLVVRSGAGKLVYDFSDKIIIHNTNKEVLSAIQPTNILKDAVRINKHPNAFFEGSMITIILPERKKDAVSYAPVRIDNRKLFRDIYLSENNSEETPQKTFAITNYEYISMLFLYEQAIRQISPSELQLAKGFDSLIYITLLEELKKRSQLYSLIFIDFEFYPRTANIHQLLFYLTNSPYINEHSKAVIVNLIDSDFTDKNHQQRYSVLKDFKINLYAVDNEPHIFRPIPCINLNMYNRTEITKLDISWIGVQYESDEELLTNLLIDKKDDYPLSYFVSPSKNSGNTFAANQGSLQAIFKTSQGLIEHFKVARQEEINRRIDALITDGANFKVGQNPFIFQASRGTFQTRYLSLYETLHNKYLAKYFAKRFLDAFLSNPETANLKFTKILSVTVSSQLIGVAIRDLIKDDPTYKSLKLGRGNTVSDCPSLIMLASYYSFETEKPFKKIEKNDQILIVNDVVSTGALVKTLVAKTIGKEATVTSVMTIADCRQIIFGESDFLKIPFFHLVKYPARGINLVGYTDKFEAIKELRDRMPKSDQKKEVDIKRINPLLNTVVELSDEDAEKHRVLFNNPLYFLPKGQKELNEYQTRYFRMGHFVQNLSHNGYLTNMRSLFSDYLDENSKVKNEGKELLIKIKEKIDSDYKTGVFTTNGDDAKLFSIATLADQLSNRQFADEIINQVRLIITASLRGENEELKSSSSYSPDFIFYPVFSGVENMPQKYFHEVFRTDYENIIGLQRFETDKGWRFPFPPKRFNNVTKNKHVLIFDSGALTGESLVQMIDTISVLDVAKIDVISVIGRVEDFNREFFSRIQSLKVKPLSKSTKNTSDEEFFNEDFVFKQKVSFANLNIFFGINLHIPVYASKSNCPFCEEIRELNQYNEEQWRQTFPSATKSYILQRLEELRIIDQSEEQPLTLPPYVPFLKTAEGTSVPDIVSIFLMRDQLGKIDSYRFYKEYYMPFDLIIKNLQLEKGRNALVIKSLELIMICILHEPKLYKVHRDLLINVHDRCKEIIRLIVAQEHQEIPPLNFEWSAYSMIRLYFIYHDKTELLLGPFEQMFAYAKEDPQAMNYIGYMLWKGSKSLFKDPFIKKQSDDILSRMSDLFDNGKSENKIYEDSRVRTVIKNIVNTFSNTPVENVNDAFFNLRKFFFSESSGNTHSELKRIINRIMSEVENKDLDVNGIANLIDMSNNVCKKLKESILENIVAIKNDVHLKNCDAVQYQYLFGNQSVYERLKILVEMQEQLAMNRKGILANQQLYGLKLFAKDLDKFQNDFLLEDTSFVTYCRKYKCDLKDCINSAMTTGRVTGEIKKRQNFSIINIKEKDVFVDGHSDLLEHAFEEIFYNAAHCVYNDNAEITMSTKLDSNSGVLRLTIFQDKPFIQTERRSGIEKIIKPIFTAFCGADGIDIDDKGKHYIIRINFSRHTLKND